MHNLNFSGLEFVYVPGRAEGLPSQGRGDGRSLKIVYFLENDFGNDDWKVVISHVDALKYVVLSKVEKHVPYGEFVGTTQRITLYPRCRTNRGRCNRVQLYIVWISERTAIISIYSTDLPIFITKTVCVYCAVQTGYLNTI
jgi:hypothetical protein